MNGGRKTDTQMDVPRPAGVAEAPESELSRAKPLPPIMTSPCETPCNAADEQQNQAQLTQIARLATLGEMAAEMAHELGQPSHIIRMAAEGALRLMEREQATQDFQKQQFNLIADQAKRMAEIIDNICIFSRRDLDTAVVFDARDSIQMAVQLMEAQLRVDGIEIDLHMTKRPCPVFGRAVQLEQVIVNLLTNAHAAVKAFCAASKSSRPGRVRVNARKSTSGNLVISIHDNGTGIDKPHLDRIFEPFFTTKDAGNGTGLGLSISCRIVASMEGRLEARNMRPHGAKFTITLPFAR